MLKCQFHTHCSDDPVDKISHTSKQLIDEAAKLKYDVLAITCHEKIVFTKQLKKYAAKKGILLIPGIEASIKKKHVLILNVKKEAEQITTFQQLREYKNNHPEALIAAPHPFFPGNYCLKKDLIENIDLFDAIEYSFCYTSTKNFNDEAVKLAKRWKKPVIATADCHILKHLNIGYTFVDSKKDPDSIIASIKQNKIENFTKATTYFKIATILFRMTFSKVTRRAI